MRTIVAACLLTLLSTTFTENAYADWHQGTIQAIAFPYEGDRAVFVLRDFTGNCSCPGYWTGYICLDPNRATYPQEVAFLLSAKARDARIHVNINETTCVVTAMYESW